MNTLKTSILSVIVISGILLIAGTMFGFNTKIQNWNVYRVILMMVCGAGYILFLVYSYRSGDKKVFKEAVIYGVLLLMISLVFVFL